MASKTRFKKLSVGIYFGRALALLLLALLICRAVVAYVSSTCDSARLYVSVLDVGQSDAILLRTGDVAMLIDTGTSACEEDLRAALLHYKIDRLDYVVLTHPHEDHIGNTRLVLQMAEVSQLVLPVAAVDDPVYALILSEAEQLGISTVSAETGQRFSLGDATVEVLLSALPEDDNINNSSTVLRVTYGTQVLLFMGDAEAELEHALLEMYEPEYLDCDLLKVGHHGSDTATSSAFVAVATPTVAAISAGKYNSYGFPHKAVLENLTAVGANVFCTADYGTLTFATDGQELRLVSTNKGG